MNFIRHINTLHTIADAPYAVWQRRALTALALCLVPVATLAREYSCSFDTECYEAEPCTNADFTVEVRDETIVTDYGTFPVLAQRDEPGLLTVFVHSDNAVYLLSASETAARFTAHVTEGPQNITYLGQCEALD